MAASFRLVHGPAPAAARPRPAPEVSIERENARFLESALVALVGSIRATRVQVLKDLVDLEARASGALDLAERVREAIEAGGLASPESRASTEWDLARVGCVLRGRAAGAHRSIALSAAGTVEAAFEVACFAAGRHLSADLQMGGPLSTRAVGDGQGNVPGPCGPGAPTARHAPPATEDVR